MDLILEILAPIKAIWVFGSRAKGTARSFSDIDICLQNDLQIPDSELAQYRIEFQESNLPYKVDLVDFHDVDDDFRKLIMSTAVRIR